MRLIAAIACAVFLLCPGQAQSHPDKRISFIIGDARFEKSPRLTHPKTNVKDVSAAVASSSTETLLGRDPQNDRMETALMRFAGGNRGPIRSWTAQTLALDDALAGDASAAATRSAPRAENNAGVANNAAVHFGPLTGPGPLGEEVASTFRDSSYTQVILNEEITLYRVYGGKAAPVGSYWTRSPPTGPLQAKIDLALDPTWGNTAKHVSIIKVPAGTTIYEGYAARQGELIGGDSQVYIPSVNPDWLVSR